MDFLTLFFLALGLSMDAFAVSVSNSMCFSGLRHSQSVATSFSFGLFQGLMPVIGFLAGRTFSSFISDVDHWIAFILLGVIGGKMLFDAVQELRAPEACAVGRTFTWKIMLMQAVATSIDALAVGVSFAALSVNIGLAAGFIAITTFLCCLVGHALGKRFGTLLGSRAQLFGGVILIGIGTRILITHLFP